MDLDELFAEVFPITSELSSLELVETSDQDNGGFKMTMRLVLWDRGEGDTRSIRDIKEQEVFCLNAEMRDDPRLHACVTGWAEAVAHVFAEDDAHGAELVGTLMPHELMNFASLLALRRPSTQADFCEAALSGKQRLGKFLRS